MFLSPYPNLLCLTTLSPIPTATPWAQSLPIFMVAIVLLLLLHLLPLAGGGVWIIFLRLSLLVRQGYDNVSYFLLFFFERVCGPIIPLGSSYGCMAFCFISAVHITVGYSSPLCHFPLLMSLCSYRMDSYMPRTAMAHKTKSDID